MTDRSPEAMEAERRALERAKIHQRRDIKIPLRDTARSKRFGNPTDALAALRETLRAHPRGPEPLYRCPLCHDTGWEEVDDAGRGTLRRCARGCSIPPSNWIKHNTITTKTKGGTFS